VAAIPLLVILSRNGEVLSDNAKKPVDSASSSPDEMTRLYNKWMRKLLEVKGLPVPEEVRHFSHNGFVATWGYELL